MPISNWKMLHVVDILEYQPMFPGKRLSISLDSTVDILRVLQVLGCHVYPWLQSLRSKSLLACDCFWKRNYCLIIVQHPRGFYEDQAAYASRMSIVCSVHCKSVPYIPRTGK